MAHLFDNSIRWKNQYHNRFQLSQQEPLFRVGNCFPIRKPLPDREKVVAQSGKGCLFKTITTIKLTSALNAAKPPFLIATIVILIKKNKSEQGKKKFTFVHYMKIDYIEGKRSTNKC